jgi:hypothetical protein
MRKVGLIQFTLYSRSYCHLCEEMHTDLCALLGPENIAVTIIDVDTDPALVEQYDELVPVLIGHSAQGSAVRLCHYFLAPEQVSAFVSSELSQHR